MKYMDRTKVGRVRGRERAKKPVPEDRVETEVVIFVTMMLIMKGARRDPPQQRYFRPCPGERLDPQMSDQAEQQVRSQVKCHAQPGGLVHGNQRDPEKAEGQRL